MKASRARRASRLGGLTPAVYRCSAKNASGDPCKAAPLKGTRLCPLHTKNRASLLGQRGGRPRVQFDVSRLTKFKPPENATDMRKMLAAMVIEMREGRIDLELATKTAYVAGIFLKSSEQEDMVYVKAELAELKSRLDARAAAQGGRR